MDLKTYIATSERGTAAKLAAELGVSPSYLSQMASGASPISPERAVKIESFTARSVGRKDLFPHDWEKIWPELALVDAGGSLLPLDVPLRPFVDRSDDDRRAEDDRRKNDDRREKERRAQHEAQQEQGVA